jgi:chaperone modulatory protein CbpM
VDGLRPDGSRGDEYVTVKVTPMDSGEFLVRARLDAPALETWIGAGWLAPRRRGEMREFSDIDVARACLILDLRKLGVNDEGIPIVLDLLDQVHGLRQLLRELLAAMRARSAAGPAGLEGVGNPAGEDAAGWAQSPLAGPKRGALIRLAL